VFTLTFTEPDGRSESHPLADGTQGLLVGRDATCDVVLQSKEVSRRHARFFVTAGDVTVEDLGSHNGVFVAGQRIEGATKLIGAPVIEIGDVRVAVAGGAKKPAAPKAAAPKAAAPKAAREPVGVGAGAVLRGKAGRQIRLPARATVGRGADCDVVLDDDSVSRRHAELSRDQRGLYRLRDLDSSNGTFLDGRRLAKEALLIPEGARLRFGDVELLFWRPRSAGLTKRQKLLIGATAGLVLLFGALALLRRGGASAEREEAPAEEATALTEQAQAAIEADRYDEAARLAQQAIDLDPLAPGPRKMLAQARREQAGAKIFSDASSKAQLGREDEALRLLAQVSPQSRFFARARIKAKDLATALLRSRGQACRSAPRDNAQEVADECGRALDVKCQLGAVDEDPLLKALRAAERRLPRRVPWSCPTSLAPLFRDESGAPTETSDDKALAALYPDPGVRDAMAIYVRGDIAGALTALSKVRGKSTQQAREATERLKIVEGRFREGQTALLGNAVDRTDQIWGEALQADAALMPAGAESFLGRQMRSTLARTHARNGDDRFAKGQYTSAYDEWAKGLAVAPKDPHLLDSMARLEKAAEQLVSTGPSCDQAQVAAHITRADPPSPAHEAAQRALERCR
jgi:pSer/pThr/pTyr-binding forkhead associated (FHA) protein